MTKDAQITNEQSPAATAVSEIKIFGKWDPSGVSVADPGLRDYINLQPRAIPHTFGAAGNRKYRKQKMSIVERFANDLMGTGHIKDSRDHKKSSGKDAGKKQTTLIVVSEALEIIAERTKKNPLQVMVNALEGTSPREETTRIRQGGIIAHKSVDSAPQRRVDIAIRLISHGAAQRCFKKRYGLAAALADEIIAASNSDNKAYSVSKKEETERVAASAR
ncbi:TPA: 30S ribosomal protein S7 [archaeon]|nr:30S ribosomal protein S7 [Candidatus Naiadarchaeales archaeon SRR2090153.bin461]